MKFTISMLIAILTAVSVCSSAACWVLATRYREMFESGAAARHAYQTCEDDADACWQGLLDCNESLATDTCGESLMAEFDQIVRERKICEAELEAIRILLGNVGGTR